MKIFLIFPNQLFKDIQVFEKYDKVIIFEDPLFFGDKERVENFNKKKLVLHRSSMKYYLNYLKDSDINTEYINYDENYKNIYKKLNKHYITIYDVCDHLLLSRLKKYINDLKVIRTPNFICSKKDLSEYYKDREEKKKMIFHQTSFYSWNRKKFDILPDYNLSYDKDNRKKLPNNVAIPKTLKFDKNNYIDEAIKYVNKNFKNNYGNTDNFYFPVTHDESNLWFKKFLKYKFSNFGNYQDAIVDNEKEIFLFHSGIAPMLNVGLLDPLYVINKAISYGMKNKIKINNIEGFVRQILGWREYMRFLYLYDYENMISSNFFNFKNKLNSRWYTGELGIKPVDDAINKAFKHGYLHHIERLMIVSNFMNLTQIHPGEAYRWFMEFSLDSYDWVMIGNVYSMGYYSENTTKPYISSSNYIIKMSDYKKNELWVDVWNALYWRFVNEYREKLEKIPRFGTYQTIILDKLKDFNIKLKLANKYIKKYIKDDSS